MTDTIRALIAACHAEPGCDLPRLVLADALDDAGQPERAELVRVQIELAADCERCRMQKTARELGVGVPVCRDHDRLRRREAELIEVVEEQIGKAFLAGFGEVPANDCEWRWERGLLHVAAPLADLEAGLRRMGTEAWWVASCHRTDRAPRESYLTEHAIETWYFWHRDDIPPRLMMRLNSPWWGNYNGLPFYPTPDLAHADLSRALLASVREPGRVATTKGG